MQGPFLEDLIEQCKRERRPLPDAIQNMPELRPDLELYFQAFKSLTSCRSSGGVLPGAIPWTAIITWCEVHGVEGEQREDLIYHIEHLDKSYLDWAMKEHKHARQREQAEIKNKSRTKR